MKQPAVRPQTRWILAFDATCATCRQIADTVQRAAGRELEILPLDHADLRAWRQPSAALRKPMLIQQTGERVRTWTGSAMVLPLTRRLGLRSTAAVLRGLGQLREESARPLPPHGAGGQAVGRSQFLRLGAGAAVAAGIVLFGKTPAFAENSCRTALEWARRNKANLPTTYDELTRYPVVYRRAIYGELSDASRSRLWLEHLKRYRSSSPRMSLRQSAVHERAVAWASVPAHFSATGESPAARELKELSSAAREAFDRPDMTAMLGTLGPAGRNSAARAEAAGACTCTDEDDLCTNATHCQYGQGGCQMYRGCGAFWQYVCNGLCIN
ncbi:bacteriocin fulvocin C-related protein [Streptomyces sp. NPDC001348]